MKDTNNRVISTYFYYLEVLILPDLTTSSQKKARLECKSEHTYTRTHTGGLKVKKRQVSIYVNELEMASRDRTTVHTRTKRTKTSSSREQQNVVLYINIKTIRFCKYSWEITNCTSGTEGTFPTFPLARLLLV
jgi:hypothetical protein